MYFESVMARALLQQTITKDFQMDAGLYMPQVLKYAIIIHSSDWRISNILLCEDCSCCKQTNLFLFIYFSFFLGWNIFVFISNNSYILPNDHGKWNLFVDSMPFITFMNWLQLISLKQCGLKCLAQGQDLHWIAKQHDSSQVIFYVKIHHYRVGDSCIDRVLLYFKTIIFFIIF